MELKAEHIALFDAYLRGEMDHEEQLDFEEKLKLDTDFLSEFELYKQFEQDLTDSEIVHFKEKLEQFEQANRPVSNNKSVQIIPYALLGIAAALIAIITVTFMYVSSAPNHTELFASNFKPYDNILTVRGEKEDVNEGMMHYENEDYKTAVSLLEMYPENLNARFYLAEAYLALNEFDLAIHTFESIRNSDGIFDEIITFHLALAYMGKGDLDQTIAQLNSIPQDSEYYDQGQTLLEELQ